MLEAKDATLGLRKAVALISSDKLRRIRTLLTPKTSILPRTLLGADSATSLEQLAPIASRNTVDTGSADFSDHTLSVAARLQACTCPDHVAAVLQSVPLSDQVHRIKLWAKLMSAEIQDLAGVSHRGKRCLEQVSMSSGSKFSSSHVHPAYCCI